MISPLFLNFLTALFILFSSVSLYGESWVIPKKKTTFAFPDIHADPSALLYALRRLEILDAAGNLVMRDANFVFSGDYFEKGPNSRKVLDILIYLVSKAPSLGSEVVLLAGNHEIRVAVGNLDDSFENDIQSYAPFDPDGNGRRGMLRVLSDPEYRYATQLQSMKAVVKIGDFIFAHAGLDPTWLLRYSPDQTNELLKSEIVRFQKLTLSHLNKPTKPVTQIVSPLIADESPLYTRRIAKEKILVEKVDLMLKSLGAKHLVVGHTLQELPNASSIYGNRVIRLDTGMSSGIRKEISALRIDGSHATIYAKIPYPDSKHPLLDAFPSADTPDRNSLFRKFKSLLLQCLSSP